LFLFEEGKEGSLAKRGSIMYLVSIIAGGGETGHRDGRGEEARFNSPRGICMDGKRNIYLADCNNHCVRWISPEGEVSTIAGKRGIMK
jgi:hypothetical protein